MDIRGFNHDREFRVRQTLNRGIKVKDILFREPKVERIHSLGNNKVKFTENENSFIKWVKYLHKD